MKKQENEVSTVVDVFGKIVQYETLDGVVTPAIVMEVHSITEVTLREFHRMHVEKAKRGNDPGQWNYII